jgi:Zn-dependent peptidase ImmA (M78 family)
LSPEAAAEYVRQQWELKDDPIYDVCGLFEYHGIKVITLEFQNDRFFGMSVDDKDAGPAIVVNTWDRISVERWIYTAAHEFAHLLLHHEDYISEAIIEDDEEPEADIFASAFLMPQRKFVKEFRDTIGHEFYVSVNKVKRIFHVSYRTVLKRLSDTTRSTYGDLVKKYAIQMHRFTNGNLSNHYEPESTPTEMFATRRRAEEPGPSSPDIFMGDRFRELLRQALDEKKIKVERAAELMRCSVHELQEWRKSLL